MDQSPVSETLGGIAGAKPLTVFVDDSSDLPEIVDYYFRAVDAPFEVACFGDTDAAVECAVKNSERVFAVVQDTFRRPGATISHWKTMVPASRLPLDHGWVAGDFYTYVIDAFMPTSAAIFFGGFFSQDERTLLDAWADLDQRIVRIEKPTGLEDLDRILRGQLQRWQLLQRNGPQSSDEFRCIQPASDELALLCAGRPEFLDAMTPRQFEELVGSLFRNVGFDVEITRKTKDGGYDIVAVSSTKLPAETTLIEVKHFGPRRPVGVGIVRALYGVKHLKAVSRVILATSSYVSPYARTEFSRVIPWELDFVERGEILSWCEQHAKHILQTHLGDK